MRFILLEILSSPSHLIDSPFIIQNAVVHVQVSYVNISYIIFLVYFSRVLRLNTLISLSKTKCI